MKLTYPRKNLSDSVVRLRRWSDADLNCIREASTNSRIPEGITVPAAFTTEAGQGFISRQWDRAEKGEGLSLVLADAATNEALGLTVLMLRPQQAVVGIGYWVIPGARDRRLATHAVSLLSTWALRDAGIARVEAWVEPENAASQRVLCAAGFKVVQQLGSFPSYKLFWRTTQDI
jgi:ribosomal-protein-alanine N-acetyltransferase